MIKGDPKIILGTTNLTKQCWLGWLLEGLPLRPVIPDVLSIQPLIDEDAGSHRGNAVLKAQQWSRAWGGGLVIASDGGLSIPILGRRWSSVYTHRFAGPDVDNDVRRETLLKLMQPYSGPERRVRWLESVALVEGGELLGNWQAWSHNCMLATSFDPERIIHGFWVDDLMIPLSGRQPQLDVSEVPVESYRHWTRLKPRIHAYFTRCLNPMGDQQ